MTNNVVDVVAAAVFVILLCTYPKAYAEILLVIWMLLLLLASESCRSYYALLHSSSLSIWLLTCLMPQLRQTRNNRISKYNNERNKQQQSRDASENKRCKQRKIVCLHCVSVMMCVLVCMSVWREMTLSQNCNGEHSMNRSSLSHTNSLLFRLAFSFALILSSEAVVCFFSFSSQHSIKPAFKWEAQRDGRAIFVHCMHLLFLSCFHICDHAF